MSTAISLLSWPLLSKLGGIDENRREKAAFLMKKVDAEEWDSVAFVSNRP